MRRAFLIIAVLANLFPARAEWKNRFMPEILVQGEYRRDPLDYDDTVREFFREKIRLFFSKESSANLAHLCIGSTREHRFTGNIAAMDISPYFGCILGNFYINFGAGLLAGRKKGISPDLFSRRLIISREKPYIPCNSGNPLYCFQGIAATVSYSFAETALSLSSFFSFRNRYADSGLYGVERTDSSFNSIVYGINKDYRHTEAVAINDYGTSLDLKFGDHFSAQGYFIYSDIRRNNKTILWNYNDRAPLSYGDKAFYGLGLFAQYRDDYIVVFVELGMPHRVVLYEGGRNKTISDYGLTYGLAFRHPVVYLSLTGKNSGKKFFSPYSSGQGYAENAWMAELSVSPFKGLLLGAGFFLEKKISPSYNETYLPHARREQGRVQYRLPHRGFVQIKFYRLEKGKRRGTERYLQLKPSMKYFVNGSILLSLSGKVQKKSGKDYSASLDTGIGFTVWNFITIMLYYSRFFISGDNYLYSTVSPYQGTITPGSFIKVSSNLAVGKITARYKEAVFSIKYEHQFIGRRSMQYRIEFFGKCLL